LANKPAAAAISATSIGSSSEANSLVSIEPVKSRESIIDLLDRIKENFDFMETIGKIPDTGSEESFNIISNYPEEDFTALYGSVSYSSKEERVSSLELHEDESIIWYSEPGKNIRRHHQMCAIIDKTSKEFDEENNLVVYLANLARGFNYRAEEDTDETVATREKICLTVAEWEIIKMEGNGGGGIPLDSDRRVLMGYQYALHYQNKHLL
jgi:hypothetical protein